MIKQIKILEHRPNNSDWDQSHSESRQNTIQEIAYIVGYVSKYEENKSGYRDNICKNIVKQG